MRCFLWGRDLILLRRFLLISCAADAASFLLSIFPFFAFSLTSMWSFHMYDSCLLIGELLLKFHGGLVSICARSFRLTFPSVNFLIQRISNNQPVIFVLLFPDHKCHMNFGKLAPSVLYIVYFYGVELFLIVKTLQIKLLLIQIERLIC